MDEQTKSIPEKTVLDALREIHDPEIPVNIVDLGLVYGITILDDWVGVKMTLTTPGCGMADAIVSKVRERILNIPGVTGGDVRLVWHPAWTMDRISPAGRKQLTGK